MQSRHKFEFLGNLISGKFSLPKDPRGEWKLSSPADRDDFLGTFTYSFTDVDQAVGIAKEAFHRWRKVKLADRIALLEKLKVSFTKKEEILMNLLAREVGKPLWEAKTEIQSLLNKIDITIQETSKFGAPQSIKGILPGTDGTVEYRPLGVMAVVGPFNFPLHLPNGHIIPALLFGNTVVFKPSEKAPLLGQAYAECFLDAGFPPGVFNLLQGERETSRRLVVHEGVDGVLFTGSYEVGVRIKQDTLHQHWKLLALEMGGKNTSIVHADAEFDFSLHEVLVSAFITAGQRCTATSRVLVEKPLFEKFVEQFHLKAKNFKIGHPFEQPFMGPLIDESSVDRYIKYQGMAQREGCELIMRGKALEHETKGNYVTPSVCTFKDPTVEQIKKSAFQQTELFAPNILVMPFESLEESIAFANATQYGLASSVFTGSREKFLRTQEDLQFGVINWNRSTTGSSSRLPFGGLKKSGNHFPTAVLAARYCTYPVSELQVANPKFKEAICEGLLWDKP